MTKRQLFKRMASVGLISAMGLSLLTGCGDKPAAGGGAEGGKPMQIKVSTVLTEESVTGKAIDLFAKTVSEKSGGRITADIYYGGVLGTVAAVTEMVQAGDVQMMTQTPVAVETQVPALATLNEYYMFDDLAHAHRFLEGEGGAYLYDSWNSMEMQGMTTFALGFRELSNNKKEVKSMEDLKSLTVRGYSPIQIAAWQAAGATPTAVDWNELFVSMQQGLINGQEGALSTMNDFSFYEVQKYITLTDHVFTCDMLIGSAAWLETLSAEDRAIVDEAVATAYTWHKDAYQKDLETMLTKFQDEYGMVITEMPDDMRAQMSAATNAATSKEIIGVCGQEVYDKVQGFVQAAK